MLFATKNHTHLYFESVRCGAGAPGAGGLGEGVPPPARPQALPAGGEGVRGQALPRSRPPGLGPRPRFPCLLVAEQPSHIPGFRAPASRLAGCCSERAPPRAASGSGAGGAGPGSTGSGSCVHTRKGGVPLGGPRVPERGPGRAVAPGLGSPASTPSPHAAPRAPRPPGCFCVFVRRGPRDRHARSSENLL